MMKKVFQSTFVLAMLLTAGTVLGQPPGGGGGSGGSGPPPVGAPVDGGAVMLLFGVVGYAFTSLKSGKENI